MRLNDVFSFMGFISALIIASSCEKEQNKAQKVKMIFDEIGIPQEMYNTDSVYVVIVPSKGCSDCSDKIIEEIKRITRLTSSFVIATGFDLKTSRYLVKKYGLQDYNVFFDKSDLIHKRDIMRAMSPSCFLLSNGNFEEITLPRP